MIRITIGLFVCACALIIVSFFFLFYLKNLFEFFFRIIINLQANAGVLPENSTIETSELSNSTESHSIDKRNILLDAWEEFKNYMNYFIRGWFRKSDEVSIFF